MALKRYAVSVPSGRNTVETILKLTPEQAKELGAAEYVKNGEVETKARTPRNKAAKAPQNKTDATASE